MSEDQTPYGGVDIPAPSRPIGGVIRPARGWIREVRASLDLTLADVARRLNITPPAVRSFEQAEAEDRITLASLRRTAEAMDCDLIYALVRRARAPSTVLYEPPATEDPGKKVTDLTWRTQHGEM